MNAVWTSLVAVLGTLAGGGLTATVQGRLARANRREARRADALTAVTQLAAALANHRRATWVVEDHRLSEAPEQAVDKAQTTRHETRAAIEIPLHTVSILVPALAPPAEEATQARSSPTRAISWRRSEPPRWLRRHHQRQHEPAPATVTGAS
jgi:hypothetical protein